MTDPALTALIEHYVHRFAICGTEDKRAMLRDFALDVQGQAWQPIATAPTDGTELLVIRGREQWISAFEDGAWAWPSDWRRLEPTHWQPLPAAPASGETTPAEETR